MMKSRERGEASGDVKWCQLEGEMECFSALTT
jgi:hypothetical protein